MKHRWTIGVIMALGTVGIGQADGLAFKPGLWRTTTSMVTPFSPAPQKSTTQECVTETEYDPARMMQDAEDCELTRNEVDGDTLNFEMTCNMESGTAQVTGVFKTDGKTGSGKMNMLMDIGGMKMAMEMDWTSERIGDC